MYNHILIPMVLDGSRDNALALRTAQALANADAQITLLHVIEMIPVYVSEYIPPDIIPVQRESVGRDLAALAADLPNAEVAIAEGRAGTVISTYAQEHGCDCIVIASHEPAFSDILLGSVAAHVVRHAKCAVHVLR